MCGIAGFVGEGDSQTLLGMIETLAHRGPDDRGVWQGVGVGLAHARLAVVDLSPGGHQPMHSKDGLVSVVFNGEIYNYKELRQELEAKGKIFSTQSDTEVIVHMYEAFGEASFEQLKGMYAFGLYDTKKESLFLVRDRMGEKPLYFSVKEGTLVFASEPKALFAHPLIQKNIHQEGIISYLTHDAALTPMSVFAGVQKLEPATYAMYAKGVLAKKTYWHPPTQEDAQAVFANTLNKLDEVFKRSVSSQMVADVPVGVFLSGGLDSSLIAYYAKQVSAQPVHTFSLGFTERSYDESSYALRVAKHLGTVHHERMVTAAQVRDALHTVIDTLDEPIADPALLPNYLLAQFAREHVTVALGGDGGDELFLGYPTFKAERWLSWYKKLPAFVRQYLVEPLVRALPVSHHYFSFDFKAKQFLRGAGVPAPYTHQAWLESFSEAERRELLTPSYRALLPQNPYARIDEYLAEIPHADAHLQTVYFYLRTYMQDIILAKVDRTSMQVALEVRAPFLDKEVVELALQMPRDFKYKGSGKYILRKLMEDRLPSDVVWRGKHGFGLPVGQWFREEWRPLLKETLSPERVAKVGICQPEVVARLVEEHVAGVYNHRKKLWSLLVLHLWYHRWIV